MNLQRTEILLGSEQLQKIKNSCILVFGVGGVGGYAVEMLARCGVGKLILVDSDKVDETNINRQIIALCSTIGRSKVSVMQERIADINKDCKVVALEKRVTKNNVQEFFSEKIDFVIDAIDSLLDKVALIKYCKDNGINIISALGAGNRSGIPKFEVCDIYKTQNDGLARKLRKLLKEENVLDLTVVYTKDLPQKTETSIVGSIAYYPAVSGCTLASYVINKIIE